MAIRKDDYQCALDVQTACNLSGVVYAFADIMKRICEDSHEYGTEWRNTHAISRLFAEQIMHLTSKRDYFEAYKLCETGATDNT